MLLHSQCNDNNNLASVYSTVFIITSNVAVGVFRRVGFRAPLLHTPLRSPLFGGPFMNI